MKKMIAALCFSAFLALGCGLGKEPVQLAIRTAEEALEPAKNDALKYFPEQLAAAENLLSEAKSAFEKGDYKGALAQAKDLPRSIRDLSAAIEARKAELPRVWEEMAASLPKLVTETKSLIDSAKGADKVTVAAARTGVREMEVSLARANEALKAGNLLGAVNIGIEIENLAARIKANLQGPTVKK